MNHVQCRLRRGNKIQISWIPQEYAVEGRHVQLKNNRGQWEDGWLVESVGAVLPSKDVQQRTQDYKNMRKNRHMKGNFLK